MSDNFLKPVVEDFKPISAYAGSPFAPVFSPESPRIPKDSQEGGGGLSCYNSEITRSKSNIDRLITRVSVGKVYG